MAIEIAVDRGVRQLAACVVIPPDDCQRRTL
jgi:hypothetical protein